MPQARRDPKCPFEPILNQIVVVQDEADKKIGSILLPDMAQKRPWRGTIVALGPGCQLRSVVDEVLATLGDAGRQLVLEQLTLKAPHLLEQNRLNLGDRVYFSQWHGTQYEHERIQYLILRESEVLGKIVEGSYDSKRS